MPKHKGKMIEQLNPQEIKDLEGARQAIGLLLNLVEEVKQENQRLREENQKMRDEINRLKGEQGKPKVKGSRKKKAASYSSEQERRRGRRRRQKGSKKAQIVIDREEIVRMEAEELPSDAEFKGYARVKHPVSQGEVLLAE
jgi:regulator of replication initiation timing